MAYFDESGPFDGQYRLNQTNWAELFGLVSGVVQGIGGELEVSANSTGMVVDVADGECRIRGHRGYNAGHSLLNIAPSDSTYARYDLIVARVTYGAPSEMTIEVKQGTPAETPDEPLPVQVEGETWEIPLARVTVEAGAQTINAADVAPRVSFIFPSPYVRDMTLTDWESSAKTLTVTDSRISPSAVIEFTPQHGVTQAQLLAIQNANILCTVQGYGSLTLTAFGALPSIGLPVTMIMR